jgi:hypothetical protein
MADSLFQPLGDGRWEPTVAARGPWSPEALHGGPVAALLARAVEAAETRNPMQPARLTVELLRPVGFEPLAVTAAVIRPGRKVQLVEATASQGGKDVARAVGLRVRDEAVAVPPGPPEVVPPPPDQGVSSPPWRDDELPAFHNTGVENRFVLGRFDRPGPATDWIRLRCPVVPDEAPSPFQRVAAAADFGHGISRMLDFNHHRYVNPDLTIHLRRLPVGEWVCLEATTHLGGRGLGLAESALYDEAGFIGRSVQSLLVEGR